MLISLALNLMQEQVMAKVRWLAAEIGMSGDNSNNEEVVKITKEDRLKQTPSDMTGNELDFNEKRTMVYTHNEEEDEINEEAMQQEEEEQEEVTEVEDVADEEEEEKEEEEKPDEESTPEEEPAAEEEAPEEMAAEPEDVPDIDEVP